jgi:hypothetical protein
MKLLDYRRIGGGHNLSIKTVAPGVLTGFCWHTPRPEVGDEIIWETQHGFCKGVLEECKWTVNVDDMYKIKVRVTERIPHEGVTVDIPPVT